MKKNILLIVMVMMLTGCNTKQAGDMDESFVKTIQTEQILVEEIQVEQILIEEIK